jgi:hypothetical protein
MSVDGLLVLGITGWVGYHKNLLYLDLSGVDINVKVIPFSFSTYPVSFFLVLIASFA